MLLLYVASLLESKGGWFQGGSEEERREFWCRRRQVFGFWILDGCWLLFDVVMSRTAPAPAYISHRSRIVRDL